mmetsp:Transcript_46900/g.138566  ORF Transcript_46900/g.138566 Transcript_46900/m.138566 type:complete len:304 (-) Transcript_46900:115-1026(-)
MTVGMHGDWSYSAIGANYEDNLEPFYLDPRSLSMDMSTVKGHPLFDQPLQRSPGLHGAIGNPSQPPSAEHIPIPFGTPGLSPPHSQLGFEQALLARLNLDDMHMQGRHSPSAMRLSPVQMEHLPVGAHLDYPSVGGALDMSADAMHMNAMGLKHPTTAAKKKKHQKKDLVLAGGSPALQNPITSLMLCNIPCCISQNQLAEIINDGGFVNTYDYMYLPMPTHGGSSQNLGYGFINFTTPDDASRFTERFHSHVFENTASLKEMQVKPAHIQGLAANIRNFRRAHQKDRRCRGLPLTVEIDKIL